MAMLGQKTVYQELLGKCNPGLSPVEAYSYEYQTAKRVLLVDWNSRRQAKKDILGFAQVAGPAGSHFISRTIPTAYPGDVGDGTAVGATGLPFMFATKIDPIEGWGVNQAAGVKGTGYTATDNDIAQYSNARMHVHYESLPWDVIDDATMIQAGYVDTDGPDEASLTRFLVKEYDPAGQMITMPKGSMKLVSGPLVNNESSLVNLAPPKYIPYWNARLTHKLLPQNAVQSQLFNSNIGGQGAIDTSLGKVNDAAFPPSGPFAGVFPQGSLLYVGAKIIPIRSPLGGRIYDVQHHFQFAYNLQNYVPFLTTAGTFGWVELSTDGMHYTDIDANAGKHIYDACNFATLFQPP